MKSVGGERATVPEKPASFGSQGAPDSNWTTERDWGIPRLEGEFPTLGEISSHKTEAKAEQLAAAGR